MDDTPIQPRNSTERMAERSPGGGPFDKLRAREPSFAQSPTLHSYGDGAASEGRPGAGLWSVQVWPGRVAGEEGNGLVESSGISV